MDITREHFGMYNDRMVTKITLENDNGVAISCMTLGAAWTALNVPRPNGTKKNLLLSFDTPAEYGQMLVGQTVGRVGGRIAKAKFKLNGKQYHLEANEGENLLHGGKNGFQVQNWNYSTSRNKNSISAIFQKEIKEEKDGFPGNILATIIYTLTNNNQVVIAYSALGDPKQDTLFNPTSRAFFNLSEHDNLSTTDLEINTHEMLQLDDESLPTGQIVQVDGTPWDFSRMRNMKEALLSNNMQGYDAAYIVNEPGQATKPVAVLRDAETGRQLTINSDRNGLCLYTMNRIHGKNVSYSGDAGKPAHVFEGLSLEAQTLPDAINQENFGDIVLKHGEKKTYRTMYTYSLNN